MSREERKMAQIIASIERMEQETRKPASRSESNISEDATGSLQIQNSSSNTGATATGTTAGAAKQGPSRVLKGKKIKNLMTTTNGTGNGKIKGGNMKIKMTPEVVERKLTPKQRWIQMWSAQTSNATTNGASSQQTKEEVMNSSVTDEKKDVEMTTMIDALDREAAANSHQNTSSPPSSATEKGKRESIQKIGSMSPIDSPLQSTVESTAARFKSVAMDTRNAIERQECENFTQQKKSDEDSKDVKQSRSEPEESTDSEKPKQVKSAASTVVVTTTITTSTGTSVTDGLRVKTPPMAETSHLSPPLDRTNSPTTAASISPSAKTKETDSSSTTTVTASTSPSKGTTSPSLSSVAAPKEEGKTSAPVLAKKDNILVLSDTRDQGKKRSAERVVPMTEEEERRAIRRRKRKSNWDVGDPRKGSPTADGNNSTTANSQFTKFPLGRPSWRHSTSMDSKPNSFYNRSSFHNNGPPPRRGFYHSNSLPPERSRSATRSSSSRYNSYNNNGYR